MKESLLTSLRVAVTVAATSGLLAVPASGEAASDAWTTPLTVDGHPDLQGVWANNNATPLERPEAWAGKEELSPEEVAELEAALGQAVGDDDALFGDQQVLAAIERTKAKSYDPTTGNYNQFWIVERQLTNRTSLVVDPADGRIPPLTPEALERQAARAEYRKQHPADSWEDRSLGERCLSFGVPRLGAGYNSYYQIFQSADHVVILMEMAHDARVIPIDGTPPLDDDIRLWHGDSRGHWEGETLVIETANFSSKSNFRRAPSKNLRLTERLTRVGPTTLDYEVTIDDPTTWTAPWTASIPLAGTEDPIFEYACHEGNYGMEGILAGYRAEERAAATAAGASATGLR